MRKNISRGMTERGEEAFMVCEVRKIKSGEVREREFYLTRCDLFISFHGGGLDLLVKALKIRDR
jgi:hypothetical protein